MTTTALLPTFDPEAIATQVSVFVRAYGIYSPATSFSFSRWALHYVLADGDPVYFEESDGLIEVRLYERTVFYYYPSAGATVFVAGNHWDGILSALLLSFISVFNER